MPIIEVQNASKTFDHVTALDRVSCAVEAGEVVGLLGPNGSGKTTLIRLLCAYCPPTSGSVRVAGYDTRVAPLEVRRRVGYVLEGVVLYPDLTVSDFLSFVGTVKKTTDRQLDAVISQCGLEGWLHRRIGTLSKGYRQRVVLAQALLGDPPVLILDEPTSGMDPEMAVKVRGLIKTLAGSRTVLLSTHSLPEARLICQRVMVLYQGRLLARGTPQELLLMVVGDADFLAGALFLRNSNRMLFTHMLYWLGERRGRESQARARYAYAPLTVGQSRLLFWTAMAPPLAFLTGGGFAWWQRRRGERLET